jgi:hypothetical protein
MMPANSPPQISVPAWLCLCCAGLLATCNSTSPRSAVDPAPGNAELQALYAADQADRTPQTAPSDWKIVSQHDRERQTRVRELLDSGAVKSGRDYYHAAMVYQHAEGADGVQLAHELAMIGACLGDRDSRWLAAASYDRMLMNLDRPQRFGTQYRSNSEGLLKLHPTSAGVTDAMRSALNVPTLGEALAREKEMQAQLEELGKKMQAPKKEQP